MINNIFKPSGKRNILVLFSIIAIFAGLMIVSFHYHDDGKIRDDCTICRIQMLGISYVIEQVCIKISPDIFVSIYLITTIKSFHVLKNYYIKYANAPPCFPF